jgi:iron-sulfur cluster assembly protein
MITLTEGAIKQVKFLLSQQPEGSFLRVGARLGGCSGMTYDVRLDTAQSPQDKVFDTPDFKLVCDESSLIYLNGMQVDFSPALVNGGFKFSNPNATGSCGCGTSFSVKTTKTEDKKSCA